MCSCPDCPSYPGEDDICVECGHARYYHMSGKMPFCGANWCKCTGFQDIDDTPPILTPGACV